MRAIRKCGVIFMVAAALAGAGPAAPATRPVDLGALVVRLGDADFAVRAEAATVLKTVNAGRRADLLAAAASADPEVKAAIWERIDAIDDDAALFPPPVALPAMNGVSLQEVVSALRPQLGPAWGVMPVETDRTRLFTLAAQERPFWDVIESLSAQHTLSVWRVDGSGRMVVQRTETPFIMGSRMGGLAVLSQQIQGVRIQMNGAIQTFTWTLAVAADPRITVLRYVPAVIVSAVDDKGHPIDVNTQGVDESWRYEQAQVWTATATFQKTADMGTKIAEARGVFEAEIMVHDEHVDVDIAKRPENLVEVGGHRIRFMPMESSMVHLVDVDAVVQGQPLPMVVTLIGPNGEEVWRRPFVGSQFRAGERMEPGSKLRVAVPTRTRHVVWAFTFKDLPLPE